MKESQLKALKENLLFLHEQGIVGQHLLGKNKAIEIRANPKPAIEVLGNPEDLPTQYRKAKWIADKEAITSDHESGVDVSDYAIVTYGQQVRFKNAPRNKKESQKSMTKGDSLQGGNPSGSNPKSNNKTVSFCQEFPSEKGS